MTEAFAPIRRSFLYVWTMITMAFFAAVMPFGAFAAPYADFVIDARTGQVLHETNADARLHPASLTKMMTLYIAFQAVENGEISLDTMVTVSKYAASQPPSRLGLKAGQRIALRYLIRAAAIKSANDAASAIGDAIEGDKERFARRMNRTAKALGMGSTTFRNANGLTEDGHLSTARDMTTLGRRLFFDFPQYYSLFSRRTADAGIAQVASTNRRFLDSYEGADGIKTGYTSPAGFNLVASAQRGNKRIIATVFGGKSTANRNARVAELLDLGFGKAPNKAKVQKPPPVAYVAEAEDEVLTDDSMALAVAQDAAGSGPAAGKTVRVSGAVSASLRPPVRGQAPAVAPVALAAIDPTGAQDDAIAAEAAALAAATDSLMAGMEGTIAAALEEAQEPAFEQTTTPQPETLALVAAPAPDDQAATSALATAAAPEAIATASASAPASSLRPAARPASAAPALPATEPDVQLAEAAPPPKPEPLVEAAPEAAPILASLAAEDQIESAEPEQTRIDLAAPELADAIVLTPAPKPAEEPKAEPLLLAAAPAPADEPEEQEIVTRVSTSGGREWGINVGSFSSRYNAERELLRTALVEMATLDEALRKVSSRKGAFDANFVGMTEETAELACRRLTARGTECTVLTPTGG